MEEGRAAAFGRFMRTTWSTGEVLYRLQVRQRLFLHARAEFEALPKGKDHATVSCTSIIVLEGFMLLGRRVDPWVGLKERVVSES
jgi:hypothetical protein